MKPFEFSEAMNRSQQYNPRAQREDHRAIREHVVLIALLAAGLPGIYWIGDTWLQLVAILGWISALLIAMLYLKEHTSSSVLLTSMMYVFVASTFLNQILFRVTIGFFTLFIYRILLIASAVVFLVYVVKSGGLRAQWVRTPVKGVLLFLCFWMAYALASLTWAWSVTEGIKYLFLLGIGMLFIFLAVFTFTRAGQLVAFHAIWMVMGGCLILIGLVNHFARIQLPSSTLFNGPNYKQGYPTAVFTNQNDFALLLSVSIFFYLAALRNVKQPFARLLCLCAAGLSVWLIIETESRACLLGVAGGIACYACLMLPNAYRKMAFWCGGLFAAAGVLLLSGKLLEMLHRIIGAPAVYAVNENPSSNTVRMNLLQSAWHYLTDTYGFGVGAGNLSVYLEQQPVTNTDQIFEVHHWLGEITGTFGLLIGGGYLVMYLVLFFYLYKVLAKQTDRKARMLVETCLTAQTAFLISSISPSSVSNLYFHWVFLGFVICCASVFCSVSKSGESMK